MGARHSTRKEWTFDTSGAAGDATPATGKSSHRSSSSSGKLRSRWSKVARSHSDRSPATRSTNPLNYGETSGTKYLQYCSPAEGCTSVSTACQTRVQSVSVMTQTEFDELSEWKMIDDDHCSCASNSPTNHLCVGSAANFDSSQKSKCMMSVDSKRHDVGKDIFRRVMSSEAKSCSSEKETSVICNGNRVNKHDCCTDVAVNPHTSIAKYLSSKTDEALLENVKPDRKAEELSRSCFIRRQTDKSTSVNSDVIKLVDKRNQSSLSESRHTRDCERFDSGQSDHMIHREDAVDFGSSCGSLSPGDMMLDTEVFDLPWPSNVRSCCDHSGYRIKHNSSGVNSQRHSDSVSGKYTEYMQNDSIDSPSHSQLAVTSGDIKHAINGSIGLDPVVELSSAVSSRYLFNVLYHIVCAAS